MSTPRKPVVPSSTPTTPRTKTTSTRGGASQTPAQGPRTRTTSTRGSSSVNPATARTRTTSTRGTATLAPPRVIGSSSRSKSPGRVPVRPPSPQPDPKSPLSIREAIALKRAQAKRAQSGSKTLKHEPLAEDIPREVQVDEVELSRWSISDSIERARSSGNLNLSSRSLSSPPTALFEIHLGVTPKPLNLAPKETEDELRAGKTKERAQTAWFEAVDLTALKLRDNVIVEIQPEISLFGSLKTLDLRNNRLTILPDTLGDLVNLVVLDLSSNQLTSLPTDIATLPMLTTLDVSSNQLTTLPLSVVASSSSSSNSASSFFAPATIERASKPLPSLRQLLASGNKLVANNVPVKDLPPDLSKCDLGNNPLGMAKNLVHALSQLSKLKQVILEGTNLTNDSFAAVKGFATLELLDLGKTKVTEKVGEIFPGRPISWEGEEIEDGVRVILGSRIKKEPWEIIAEKGRSRKAQTIPDSQQAEPLKEAWEVEAENGLLTEGGRRRARAAAAQLSSVDLSPTARSSSSSSQNPSPTPTLTQYYDSAVSALTLPRSLPRAHTRSRSLAPMLSDGSDPTVPAPTLPLPVIVSQPFASTLRVLVLSNRRLDPSFILPANIVESEPLLPALEELRLDCCSLCDSVSVLVSDDSHKDPIFSILASLFPSLTSLDLSDNKLTCLSGVRALLIPDPARKTRGLKALKVRGNRISDLMGLEAVAQVLKSEGRVEAWRLEELDIRDNEIAKLPPMLGYLPLDVLLVEGNTFRVPARRVWEREGTKGLLSWLKDRVE
ncbi:hypothetical protein JB92DRAFT_2980621 [Gautieria morchelliformis]|nr:hypothetical protein JB92DRAFT_2980621 [Gautieria morchelliformis]